MGKKVVFIGVLISLLIALGIRPVYAWRENVVSINPLGFIVGVADVEWERVLRDDLAVAGSILYAGDDWWSIFGIGAGVKRYHRALAPEGFWYGGTFSILHASWEVPVWPRPRRESIVGFSIGGGIGYKWIFENNMTIEPSASLSFFSAGEADIAGVVPGLGLRVGFAF